MAEADIHETGFCTPFGNFEWLRKPFGLVNALTSFQRAMDNILEGLDAAYPYVDNISVYSNIWHSYLHQEMSLQHFHARTMLG